MTIRKLTICSVLLALLGAGTWFGWRWYTTPAPPAPSLDGVDPAIAELIETNVQEVRRKPRSSDAWGKLGMILSANGFGREAIECYRRAEQLEPGNPRWPYLAALDYFANDPKSAIGLMRRALGKAKASDERTVILFRLAQALVEDGQLDDAERHLGELRQIKGDGSRVNFGLGLLHYARGDVTEARTHLSKLANNPHARRRVRALLAALGDPGKEGSRTDSTSIEHLPVDVPWSDFLEEEKKQFRVARMRRIARFMELDSQGRQAEALAFLRQFVAQSPDADVCQLLGTILIDCRQPEEAEQVLQQAVHLNPRLVKAHFNLGLAFTMQGEKYFKADDKGLAQEFFRRAVAAEDRALAIQADHGYAHLIRGRALHYLGRRKEALAALREALTCQPEYTDMHLYLGEALAEAGQLKEALEHLENAVRLADPDNPRPGEALKKWQAKASPPRNGQP
jgi:tetratricopeptide (TPR) repeat protein